MEGLLLCLAPYPLLAKYLAKVQEQKTMAILVAPTMPGPGRVVMQTLRKSQFIPLRKANKVCLPLPGRRIHRKGLLMACVVRV